jgi:hypothetical protein
MSRKTNTFIKLKIIKMQLSLLFFLHKKKDKTVELFFGYYKRFEIFSAALEEQRGKIN